MDIKLYYIEGISRTDTPYFATKGVQATLAKQEEYFEEHIVQTISTSFYPPHYNNEIKFDIEDLTFNTNVNYLSLEYGYKTYYYFIDDIEYISESIIKLYVTMDVIQTYMFNIRIANGVIERKFINRWTNANKINRNYIRENVSKDEFVVTNFNVYNSDVAKWYVVVKKTELFSHKTTSSVTNYYFGNALMSGLGQIPSSATFAFAPVLNKTNAETITVYYAASGQAPVTEQKAPGTVTIGGAAYATAVNKAWAIDCYVCPFEGLVGLSSINDSFYIDSGLDGEEIRTEATPQAKGYWIIPTEKYQDAGVATIYRNKVKVIRKDITLGFSKNDSLNVPFNDIYMPVLLDTNYIHLTFGSYYANTTYPLYNCETDTLRLWYTFLLDNGYRYYLINESTNSLEDKYRVGVTDDNVIALELKNNAWESYISQNRSRWIGAIGTTALGILTAKAASAPKIGKIGVDASKSETVKYGQARKVDGKFAKGIKRIGKDSTATQRNVYGEIPGSGESPVPGILGAVGKGVGSQLLSDINANCSPSTLKSSGSTDGFINKGAYIFSAIEKCRDYVIAANYYHRNGYLVNDYVNAITNVFQYVQNRYYFNVLKMSIPEVHLANVIEDETTLDLIKERLEEGVRLWNVKAGDTWISYQDYHMEVTPPMHFPDTIHFVTLPLEFANVTNVTVTVEQQDADMNVSVVGVDYTYVNNILDVTILARNNGSSAGNVKFKIVASGTNTWYTIGDFTYDNVELDYIQ